uniref:Putative secreted protein n=1 Tax=Amblyomma parvum TaxID=251391 RepID=A0A023G0M6_AMBPA
MKILFVFPFLTAGCTCSRQVSTRGKCPADDDDCARNHDHFGRQHPLFSTAQTETFDHKMGLWASERVDHAPSTSLHTPLPDNNNKKLQYQMTPKRTVHSLQGKKRGRNKYVVGPYKSRTLKTGRCKSPQQQKCRYRFFFFALETLRNKLRPVNHCTKSPSEHSSGPLNNNKKYKERAKENNGTM